MLKVYKYIFMNNYIYKMRQLIANIKLPLIVNDDGSISPVFDSISISVENLETLSGFASIIQNELNDKIQAFLNKKSETETEEIDEPLVIEQEEEINLEDVLALTVLPEELTNKDKKNTQNSTLKNYKGISSKKYRSTMKNHHSISNS
jgi:hypothetical protein